MSRKTVEKAEELTRDTIEAMGYELADVEFAKEQGEWVLTFYIDKPGGVNIDDCEKVSRAIDPILDEADPIESSYMFEVSSAGCERQLKRPSDFERFMGEPILLKTYKPVAGRKEFAGVLAGYDNGSVLVDMGSGDPLWFEKADIAMVRLRVEF